MQTWDLRTLAVEPHRPEILQSARGEGRSIALRLPAGDSLQEHEVHERAYVVVTDGAVEFANAAGDSVSGGPASWRCSSPVSATRYVPWRTPACC